MKMKATVSTAPMIGLRSTLVEEHKNETDEKDELKQEFGRQFILSGNNEEEEVDA